MPVPDDDGSERPRPIATLRENLSTNFARLDRIVSTFTAVALVVLPLAQTLKYGLGQSAAFRLYWVSAGVSVVLTVGLLRWRPEASRDAFGPAIAAVAGYLALRWLLGIGASAPSWTATGQAVGVYLFAFLASYLLLYRNGYETLKARLSE